MKCCALRGAAFFIPMNKKFKSGFVVMAGLPNAGKSTLLNVFAGGLLSPISPKPQTTRQNILAISESDGYQIIFVDTPGFLSPKYKLQRTMTNALTSALNEDADIVLLVADPTQNIKLHEPLLDSVKKVLCPVYLVVNKTDAAPGAAVKEMVDFISAKLDIKKTFLISAKNKLGVDEVKKEIISALPEGPEYFAKGQWTDKWERFYAAEFIREQIFHLYDKEVPYCTYVEIDKFSEDLGEKNFIRAVIHVERETQKPIIIGRGGKMIARLREAAQKRIVEFLGRKYRLELVVEVSENWRSETAALKKFGYME